jgi:hypothetical protein
MIGVGLGFAVSRAANLVKALRKCHTLAEYPSDSVAYSRSNDRLGALRISQRTSAN